MPGAGYTAYTTPYLGLHQVLKPDGLYRSQQRFGMYRWHIPDPVRFRQEMRATIQCLGSGPGDGNGLGYRYRPNGDDIASTVFFYLDAPSAAASLPPAPTFLSMEVD